MIKTNPVKYSSDSNDNKRRTLRLKIAICVCLFLCTLAAYEPVRHNDFVRYDDYAYVSKNPHVNRGITPQSVTWAFTKAYLSNWYPLTWISHMLDFEIYGSNPAGHHFTSLLIHTAAALLLFLTLSSITSTLWPGAFAAAVFALHPLHVESVAWAAERKDVLSGFFWILTILAYAHYAKLPNLRRYFLLLASFALAAMSKPMVVTLPLVLLLLDYWPLERFGSQNTKNDFQKTSINRLVIEKLPLFAMSAALSVVTFIAQKNSGAVTTLERVSVTYRIANALISYISYIQKTVWPSNLAAIYPVDVSPASRDMWPAFAVVFILITVLCVYIGRHKKYVLVGWLWYVGTLVPVIGLVHVGSQAMADRYMYIPMTGLLIIAAWGLKDILSRRPFFKIALALSASAILLLSIILTRVQVTYWQNSLTLFEHALKVTKNNSVAEDNYGYALIEAGKPQEGLPHLRNAVRLSPSAYLAHIELARALLHLEKYKEAAESFENLTRFKEASSEVFGGLGTSQLHLARYEQAIENLNKAIQMEPDNVDFINNLAWLYATCRNTSLQNPDKAVDLAKKACLLTNYINPLPLDTLAAAYACAGQFDLAVKTAGQAMDIIKNSKDSYQQTTVSEIQKRLDLYKAGRPYIEKQNTQ
jgi:tetratricopeptide (TPR) repeat protein